MTTPRTHEILPPNTTHGAATPRYRVRNRRMGTVHIVRWYEVERDGVHIDTYEEREMAHAYVDYMNARHA